VTFSDPENMKKFMESKIKEMQTTESEKIETLKRKINTRINQLYNEVCKTAFGLDKYRIPIHGIPNPSKENPMNLF